VGIKRGRERERGREIIDAGEESGRARRRIKESGGGRERADPRRAVGETARSRRRNTKRGRERE